MGNIPVTDDIWEQGWTAEQPFFKSFAQMKILTECKNIIGVTEGRYLIYGERSVVRAFLSKNTYKRIQESGEQLFQQKVAEQTIQEIKDTILSFWSCVEKLRTDTVHENLHSVLSINQFREFNLGLLKVFAYFRTTWEATVSSLEQRLKDLIQTALQKAWEEACILAVTPVEPDLLFREKLSWLEVLEKPTEIMIQRYMFRYPYHFCNCDSESDALDIVKERIKKDSISTLKAEIEKSQNEFKKLKAQQQLLFKEVNSQEVQQIAYVLQQFALLRFELKNCWAGIHYSLFPLFRHIAQATGQTIGDVMMYWSMKDILTFFETKIAVDKEEIKQRKKFYLFLLENNTISFWVGDEAKKTKGAILERDLPKHVSSFEGSVACRGKTTGIVKIISFDDIRIIEKTADGIKQDFILVTGMTNPNMVPLIKKAKAIVTDEGGITCHAAIISREFNIPCIVGTKIATQVLKDGDVVEVNAYDGIVRKIK